MAMYSFLVLAVAVASAWGQGFQLSFGTQGPQQPAAPTRPFGAFDPNCADKIQNCYAYGADACKGQYRNWAAENCELTCGFCVGPATTPPPCIDVLDNCAGFEKDACTSPDYSQWAHANCRRTCRLCPASVLAQLDAMTTTIPPSQCVDKVDCRLYTKSACSGTFEHWAHENCANYCGFCQGVATTKPCLDTRPNCAQYDKDMCTNPQYKIWVDDNCPQYCGRCGGGSQPNQPTPPPYNTPPPLPGRR